MKQAIVWRVAVDLVRHYPSHGLRIIETHPCGGLYDCITLYGTHGSLASFNLAGTGLLLLPCGPPRRGPSWADALTDTVWRYPPYGLGEDASAFAEAIAARCGLQARVADPPRTISSLTLSVLRELLARHAFASRGVVGRNAWFDTSAEGGSSIRGWAHDLPGVSLQGDWPDLLRSATRYWSFDRRHDAEIPAVIVDVSTGHWWHHGAQQPGLAPRFAAGEGVRALAWRLERALDAT